MRSAREPFHYSDPTFLSVSLLALLPSKAPPPTFITSGQASILFIHDQLGDIGILVFDVPEDQLQVLVRYL